MARDECKRRRLLQFAGLASAGLLAGCTDDPDDPDDEDNGPGY